MFTDYPLRDSKYIDMCLDAMDIFETSRVISVKKMNNVFYKHSDDSDEIKYLKRQDPYSIEAVEDLLKKFKKVPSLEPISKI